MPKVNDSPSSKRGGSTTKKKSPSKKSSTMIASTRTAHSLLSSVQPQEEEDHPDLLELEEKLTHQVDDEFFEDPRKFHTLHRVIDVLGMQLEHDPSTHQTKLEQNPAYQTLRQQQKIVEEAIEHLALIHCADLNGSVVQVGRVARQFQDAVTQVRSLRKQVQEIQETLGSGNSSTNNTGINSNQTTGNGNQKGAGGTGAVSGTGTAAKSTTSTTAPTNTAMSLRELWLKKLEAEAVLSLLGKLDRIRAAPRQFDLALEECRLGAAVLCVAQALETMFSSDVSQVQALHKIMEQLMMRKQMAEELVWQLLLDVLFLRTGNGRAEECYKRQGNDQQEDEDNLLSSSTTFGMVNPFLNSQFRFALETDLHVQDSHAVIPKTTHSAQDEDWQQDDKYCQGNMMIPPTILEAEFDLESEERRHLEELQEHEVSPYTKTGSKQESKWKYRDPLLAIRTLVDCLIRLRRLDDVERILLEHLPKELETLVQKEQARTFVLVEQASTKRYQQSASSAPGTTSTDLQDFRRHLQGVVSAFGNVQLRLAHLAQVVRYRLATEKMGHSAAFRVPSSALSMALKTSKELMERELKTFLDACLQETPEESKESEFNIHMLTNVSGQSRQIAAKTKAKREGMGLFSLGIVETLKNKDLSAASTAEAWLTASTTSRRTQIQTYDTAKFVAEVLFGRTTHNGSPQVRHALFFRRVLDQWHQDSATLRHQLAKVTMEDTTDLSFHVEERPALDYLDVVIQKDLLPVLQEEAVNGTVQALERPDAFDPVLDRNVYKRNDSNEPQDVDMCRACHALHTFTGPLFLALHRLPKGGEMYLPLVAVLEHVILTFISRVKQQVQRLCQNRTALQLIMETTADGSVNFSAVMERRKAFAQLVLAYADGDLLEATAVSEEAAVVAAPLLSPSTNDSPSKAQLQASRLAALGMEDLDFVGGVEREELNLSQELQFVKPFLEFAGMTAGDNNIRTCTDEILMKSACLGHSLLKLSSLLDSRLKVRSSVGGIATKTLTNTRALREAIKTIKVNGLKMAKFCRADVLLQAITRLSKVCNSSTVVARDAVRIPSSVNDLGEYMTAASDNLREAAGNAVTAYTFSTLEQYIPLCLIQTVRVLAAGKGIVTKAPLTMNGIEALDRSGSVLYRDLKGATSFDNSFWDIELAAVSFERSASFIAMMELEMPELEAYYQENHDDFSEQDFQLMFGMNGPRRKGDTGRYHMLVKRLGNK